MNRLTGIDFIYQNKQNHNVIIGSKGKLYGTDKSVDEVLMILCESHGRHVNGSKAIFAKVTNGHQKLGVLVDPQREEIYFPSHAASNDLCIWINYGRVYNVVSAEHSQSRIIFKSGHEIKLNCSTRSVNRQLKRCRTVLESLGDPFDSIHTYLIEQ